MDEHHLFGELLDDFVLESSRRLEIIEKALLEIGEQASATSPGAVEDIRRELHTLKGNAGMMGLREIQSRAHEMEEAIVHGDALTAEQTTFLLQGVDTIRTLLRLASGHDGSDSASPESAIPDTAQSGLMVQVAAVDAIVELLADSMILGSRLARQIEMLGEPAEPMAIAWEALQKTLTTIHRRALALRL